MTLPRVESLGRYQERWPPLHKMVAGYLGLGKKPVKPGNIEAFIAESMVANLPR